MKNFLSFVFILCLLFVISCGGTKPPQPPAPPQPSDVCGDGNCTGVETPSNCAADCKSVPPETKCGNGSCDAGETRLDCPTDCGSPAPVCGDEPLDKDCPEIKTDFSINKILGIYIGVDGTPNFDWIWLFSELDKHDSFNWVYIHLNSPWENQGFYMWEFDPAKKVYTQKWNEKYWQQFRLMLRAAGYYDRGVMLTFLNEYCNLKWLQNAPKNQSQFHPFRNNLAKVNLCGDGRGQAPLYRNWNRRLPLEKNVAWMFWKDENDISTFNPTNIAGEMIFAMIERVATEVKEVMREYPNLRVAFRPANEPWRFVLPDGKKFDDARGNPLDDRTFTLVFQTLKRAGLRNRGNIRFIVEEEFLQNGDYINSYWTDKTYRQYTKPRNYLYEFHGVVEVKDKQWTDEKFRGEDIEFFTNTLKMDHRLILLSNDGDKGEKFDPKNYYKRLNQIYKWQLAHPGSWFDYKVPSDVPPCPWKAKDMNANMKCFLPQMQREIFKKVN